MEIGRIRIRFTDEEFDLARSIVGCLGLEELISTFEGFQQGRIRRCLTLSALFLGSRLYI